MKYVVIPLRIGHWIWELRRQDASAICRSAAEFASIEDALRSIQLVREATRTTRITDLLGNDVPTDQMVNALGPI